MLRRFLYLNSASVDSYLGVVEGGLSDETTKRGGSRGTKGGGAGADAKVASVRLSTQRENSEESERVVRETPEIRFDRLMKAVSANPEDWDFEEVLNLTDVFDQLAIWTLIQLDCDIEIPPAVRLLAQPDELNKALDLMEIIGPMARVFGSTPTEMPDPEQLQAIRAFSQFSTDLVITGEIDDSSPRIAGKLDRQFMREMPEGEACVVGKISRRWKSGESHSLIALPGSSLMTRAQKRAQEHSLKGDENNMLNGPALTLDILAIYR